MYIIRMNISNISVPFLPKNIELPIAVPSPISAQLLFIIKQK